MHVTRFALSRAIPFSASLRPLPFSEPDRLVSVFHSFQQQGVERGPACVADFLDWKTRAESFQTLDAIVFQSFTLTGDGEAEQIPALSVTSTFFETLGSRPIIGRTFTAGEDQPGRAQTVVISEHLWRKRYAASAAIIGKQIAMNGRPFTIIGVMPQYFKLGGDAQAWAIFTLNPPLRRGPFLLQGLGKLKDGVSVKRASDEMQALAQQVESQNAKDYTRLHFPVVPLHEVAVGDIRPMLLLLAGAVFAIFLISVFNVANLMLARAASR